MKLNKTYNLEEKTLRALLDKLNEAMEGLYKFSSDHPGYNFEVNVNESTASGSWTAEINVKYEKQKDKTSLLGSIEPPTLL